MDYIYAGTGIGFLGIVIYYYLTKNYGYWKKRRVPYLKDSLPGLGNVYPVLLMRKTILDMYQEFYNAMPGCSMVGFYHLREPALLIRDPELVKSVLQTNFASFSSNGVSVGYKPDHLLSGDPFVLDGEKWRAARQQLSSAFTSGKLKFMYESIYAVSEKLISYLDDKIAKGNDEFEVELKELFSKYTAEVVSSAAFGVQSNSFKDDRNCTFTEIGNIFFGTSFIVALKQFILLVLPFSTKIVDLGFIPPNIEKIFINLLRDILKYRADHNIKRNDFLQLMINLKKSGASDFAHGGEFNDMTITSYAASFFFDVYETPCVALSFVGYQLASHPKIQQRARDEVLTVIEKYNKMSYEALNEMTYMDQVICESMRLHPADGALIKVCTNEIDLKGSDGITCQVMPGTQVMISLGGLHKDPQYWPDPEKFDPDRFTDENKQKRHRFTYLPFGEGPRICMGRRLSILGMKAAIAATLKRYTFELSPKTEVPIQADPGYYVTTALGGVWVKLKSL